MLQKGLVSQRYAISSIASLNTCIETDISAGSDSFL